MPPATGPPGWPPPVWNGVGGLGADGRGEAAVAAEVPAAPAAVAAEVGRRGHSTLMAVASRAGRALVSTLVSAVVVVGLWYAFIEVFNLYPLVAKDPRAVYDYLFTVSDAAANRDAVFGGLWHTLGDAVAGYVTGMVAAIVAAVASVLYRPVEQALTPVAMMLRSVPMPAMTPLLTLIFGRGLPAIVVIVGIVVFFPTLVNLVVGMRSAPVAATDLVRAYGGGPFTVLRKVAFPSALPAFFASARIAVPGAVVGALLAELLATGKGLGYLMQGAQQKFDYGGVWAAVVVVTAASVMIYALVGCVETLVLARYGPAAKSG